MATTRYCDDCGSILQAGDDDCRECSPEGMADRLATQQDIDRRAGLEPSDRTKRRRKQGDPYNALEKQVRHLDRRGAYVQRELRRYEAMTKDTEDLTVEMQLSITKAQKQLAEEATKIATAQAKCAGEMGKIMSIKSRMVDSLTREEQIAQIIRWARGLATSKMSLLIENLQQVYNDEKSLRTARKASRRNAKQRSVSIVR